VCKEFLLTPGGIDRYEGVEVRILPGHNPDLVIEHPVEKRVNLTQYATLDDLHALMRAEGFVERDAAGPQNKRPECYEWRTKGECLRNPTFMNAECALACRDLHDTHAECAAWARDGQCESNGKYMLGACPVSCGWKKEL